MARELVLLVVSAALSAFVVWMGALCIQRLRLTSRDREQLAWWRLMAPLLAGAIAIAFVAGWALQEPQLADEKAGIALHLAALAPAAIILRAVRRALDARHAGGRARIVVGTVGLLRPRVVVSEEFSSEVPLDVMLAALAHEQAHMRHLDPLRIWFAQLAADLQWPIPGTQRRLADWVLALEAERDDEAVHGGVAPEDLAEAILTAARLQGSEAPRAWANAVGGGEEIAWRVRRLMSGERSAFPAHQGLFWIMRASCTALILQSVWLGTIYGDAVLSVLPGME